MLSECFAVGRGYEDGVFVAVAEFAFEVDTGFEGEGHAGLDGSGVFGVEGGLFVDFQAEGVTGGVGEVGAVAFRFNDVSGGLVDVFCFKRASASVSVRVVNFR